MATNRIDEGVTTTFEALFTFVREYNRRTLTPEAFSDLLAQDLDNVSEARKELDRWRYRFDQRRCTTLPELTQIAEQCEALDSSLREKAVDYEVLGNEYLGPDEWVNAVWDALLPDVERLRNGHKLYAKKILELNRDDGLIGTKEKHGRCCRASWVEFPEDERTLRKERITRHFFRARTGERDAQARMSFPIQKATYFPKEAKTNDLFSSVGFCRHRMQKQIESLPRLVRPLARLEYGHRADGVGEHVLLLLIGNFVICGQRVPSKAPPRVQSPTPKRPKQSLWKALRGMRYLLLFGLLGVGSVYGCMLTSIESHEVAGAVSDIFEATMEVLDDVPKVLTND